MNDEYTQKKKKIKINRLFDYYGSLGNIWGRPLDNEDHRAYYLVAGLLVLSESVDDLCSIIGGEKYKK